MNTKPPACWSSDPNARTLRIEASPETSLLLPLDQFAYAEITSDGNDQVLRLVFATNEVTVRGYSLRRIETALQRLELSCLSLPPDRQRSLVPEGQPVIGEIIVTNAKESSRTEAGQV